eukprot:gene42-biopygen11
MVFRHLLQCSLACGCPEHGFRDGVVHRRVALVASGGGALRDLVGHLLSLQVHVSREVLEDDLALVELAHLVQQRPDVARELRRLPRGALGQCVDRALRVGADQERVILREVHIVALEQFLQHILYGCEFSTVRAAAGSRPAHALPAVAARVPEHDTPSALHRALRVPHGAVGVGMHARVGQRSERRLGHVAADLWRVLLCHGAR